MDIQHLVDRLEDLIDEGRHLFGTKYTMIDEERALEIIDQMRISIPEEIEKSARIMQQRERILSEAHEEAARIVQQNRIKAEAMMDEDSRCRRRWPVLNRSRIRPVRKRSASRAKPINMSLISSSAWKDSSRAI